MTPVADDGAAASRRPEKSDGPSPPASSAAAPPRTRVYLAAGVAIVVVVVALAYVLTDGFHPAGKSGDSSPEVLIKQGTSYSMNIGEFNGIYFSVNSSSTIDGHIDSSRGISIYVLTPPEFQSLSRTLKVGNYTWTSGVVADNAVYTLHTVVLPGEWVLSFVNPNPSTPTGVGIYSDVTLTTG